MFYELLICRECFVFHSHMQYLIQFANALHIFAATVLILPLTLKMDAMCHS